jgi:hypothetical protein
MQRRGDNTLVDYLKGLQVMDSKDKALIGAMPGSFPIFGEYKTGGYPDGATKYFLDSLMLLERFSRSE